MGNFVRKADFFSKRTIKQRTVITHVDTATEALAVSLSEKARVDMPELPKAAPEEVGRNCPNCGKPLVYRTGRFGPFISCSGYPECDYKEKIEKKVEKLGVACPNCGGDLIVKRTKRGKIFYGCANFPKCDYATWNRPLKTPCPNCGGLLVRVNKNTAQCQNPACAQFVPIEEEKDNE